MSSENRISEYLERIKKDIKDIQHCIAEIEESRKRA